VSISIICGFCDHVHRGDFLDEIDDEIMACRERASALKRGELDAMGDLETFTVRCEAAIPGGITGAQDSARAAEPDATPDPTTA